VKIGVRLFLSSMLFAVLIAGAYVIATHDYIGTVMLATMAVALITIAVWIVVAEREADLGGDHPERDASDAVGENLGMFTLESYWPICGALATTLMTIGIVFLPGASAVATLFAAALLLFVLRFLVREST